MKLCWFLALFFFVWRLHVCILYGFDLFGVGQKGGKCGAELGTGVSLGNRTKAKAKLAKNGERRR